MTFAARIFFWAGIYGVLVLLPMFFLEERIGLDYPPATNHPEQYYGFLGVALAWQFVFLLIGRDPQRYRPLMLPALVEKFVPASAALWLHAGNRISHVTLAPFIVDLILGVLFLLAYLRSGREAAASSGTD